MEMFLQQLKGLQSRLTEREVGLDCLETTNVKSKWCRLNFHNHRDTKLTVELVSVSGKSRSASTVRLPVGVIINSVVFRNDQYGLQVALREFLLGVVRSTTELEVGRLQVTGEGLVRLTMRIQDVVVKIRHFPKGCTAGDEAALLSNAKANIDGMVGNLQKLQQRMQHLAGIQHIDWDDL